MAKVGAFGKPELKLGYAVNALKRREQFAAEAAGREYAPLNRRGMRCLGQGPERGRRAAQARYTPRPAPRIGRRVRAAVPI